MKHKILTSICVGLAITAVTLAVSKPNSSQGDRNLDRPAFESIELSSHDMEQMRQAVLQMVLEDLGGTDSVLQVTGMNMSNCHTVEHDSIPLNKSVAMSNGEMLEFSMEPLVSVICEKNDSELTEIALRD